MKTFEQIYTEMCDKRGFKFSVRELLKIFETENFSWIGETQQLLELRSIQLELTGIRPGNCPSCNVEVVKNMIRWVNKYEQEHPKPELRDMEEKIVEQPKRKRGF